MAKQQLHLLCNAHLDPVWLWQWQEGAAEAISTFRTAVEICEENKGFIFNHNEVVPYQWVEEYDPPLFKRIQKQVSLGRWHIMGGWYLQPDCNMPSGESFVRQILLGKSYFKDRFGKEPNTAINFDPFGHSKGLVQILAKSGYDSYLFGRPRKHELKLPAEQFKWVGFDGSEIMACRFEFPYCSGLGKAREKIEACIKENPDANLLLSLWGVGNHGGGPSKKDISDINSLMESESDINIKHSTPEAYFKALKKTQDKMPSFDKDLNPWAVGCYTSQIRIKQKQRQLENDLYVLEKIASCAAINKLMVYPSQEIHEAMCDLMTSQFHDTLPGSSIEPVEEKSLETLGHGLEIASRLKARAFFALASGQKKAKTGEIPIMVYNPHPYEIEAVVECEFNLADHLLAGEFMGVQVYSGTAKIPSQVEHELSNIYEDWRKRVIFKAKLAPSQMNRFDCKLQLEEQKKPELKIKSNKIVFKTKDIEVRINSETGFIDKYSVKGIDCLGREAFKPLLVGDNADPWGMIEDSFPEILDSFKLMSPKAAANFSGYSDKKQPAIRMIEDGDVRSVIEAVFSCRESSICMRYKLPKKGSEVEVELIVHWNEKDKMLKLSVPVFAKENKYVGQVAYGTQELPSDGGEAVSQKWSAAVSRKNNVAVTLTNDGVYGSSFVDNQMRPTLLRSPGYSAHPTEDEYIDIHQGRYMPRSDQGVRKFKFWLNAGKVTDRLKKIDRESLAKNEEVIPLSFFPLGGGVKPKPLAVLDDDAVVMTAYKKAQKGSQYIIRLFEPTGKKRSVQLSLPVISKKKKINLAKFEIKTYKVDIAKRKLVEVDLMERKLTKKKGV